MEASAEITQRTPLYAEHIKLGAKTAPFAGWEMPIQYREGILAEHKHCREHAALFDICHMGEFRISGPHAASDLNRIFARSLLDQGQFVARYSFLLTDQGTVRDDLVVYRMDENEFFVVVNAGPRPDDAAWIKQNLSSDTVFVDESDATAKLDLQGPESAQVLARLGIAVEKLPGYYKCTKVNIAGIDVLLSRTGYTGELGFELYFDAAKAVEMWNLILQDPVVKPAGLGARDTLRLEVGYPLYGHEMDLTTTPIEAGFGPMLKLSQRSGFIGDAVLCDPVKSQPKRVLKGFAVDSRRAARSGAEIVLDGKKIGVITSGAFAPSLEKSVAMGYVDAAVTLEEGQTVQLLAGGKPLDAVVTQTPFYKNGTVRTKLI